MNKPSYSSCRVIVLWLATMLALVGCNLSIGDGSSPSVWIDRPLNGESVPLAAVIIQAHAADADGIAKIEFLLFDTLISSVSTGGARMEEASIEWTPPAPGVYTLNVRATDTQGNSNARTPASVQITVAGGTPTPVAGDTPTPAAGDTPTPASALTGSVIQFWADPPEVQAGACTDIRWHVENVQRALFGGIDQPLEGSYEDCLCESQRYTLTVIHHDGSEEKRQVNVNVTGSCAAPVPQPFVPIDTTPPSISDMAANPALISVQTQCGATPPTTLIRARVSDAGGIARVVARVSGVGEFEMSPTGDEYYQVTLGPFGEAGTLSIFVQAQDNAGNSDTSAPISVQVVACPG